MHAPSGSPALAFQARNFNVNIRFLSALALVVACAVGGCSNSAPSAPTPSPDALATATTETTAPGPPSKATSPTPATSAQATVAAVVDEASEECHSFTIALDRFVFIRLQPIVEEATDLLHSASESVDPTEVATELAEASRQLLRLVDELDLMGVPPREIVDLLLSIREGTLLFATGFEKGARGWAEGDADVVSGAKDEIRDASAVLTEFFGWQLCG